MSIHENNNLYNAVDNYNYYGYCKYVNSKFQTQTLLVKATILGVATSVQGNKQVTTF